MNYPDWLPSLYYYEWDYEFMSKFWLWTEFNRTGIICTIPLGLIVWMGFMWWFKWFFRLQDESIDN